MPGIRGCRFHDLLKYNDYRGSTLPRIDRYGEQMNRSSWRDIEHRAGQASSRAAVCQIGYPGDPHESSWAAFRMDHRHTCAGSRRLGAGRDDRRTAGTGQGPGLARRPARPARHLGPGRSTADDGASPELPERLDDSRLSVLDAGRYLAEIARAAADGDRPGLPGERCPVIPRGNRLVGRSALLPDLDRRASLDAAVRAFVQSRAGGAICGDALYGSRGSERPGVAFESGSRVVAGGRGGGPGVFGSLAPDGAARSRRTSLPWTWTACTRRGSLRAGIADACRRRRAGRRAFSAAGSCEPDHFYSSDPGKPSQPAGSTTC